MPCSDGVSKPCWLFFAAVQGEGSRGKRVRVLQIVALFGGHDNPLTNRILTRGEVPAVSFFFRWLKFPACHCRLQ